MHSDKKEINESPRSPFPLKTEKIDCSIDEYLDKNGYLRLEDYGEWIDQVFNKLQRKVRDE